MAVLEKIRVKFGLGASIIIALGLLSFIVDPSSLISAFQGSSSKYDVGSIAGKKISYTDFQADVERYTTINELVSGTSAQNEETQKSIRNAAWQELLDKYMFLKNAKAAGITVGEKEMLSLVSGQTVSPVLAQNSAFVDETGNFSVEALRAFVQNVNLDETGQLRTYWNYLQNTILNQQYYQKYGALFAASNFENALQLNDDLAANNTTADVDYILSYYPVIQDSTITVSSDEIRKFYKDHKDFFRQNANREIEYVVFEVVPSADDIAATSSDMEKAYEEFVSTDNMKNFLLKNSESQLSNYWYKAGDLAVVNSDIDNAIFAEGQTVTPIIATGNSFYAARVLDSQKRSEQVFVKHILLQGENAKNLADSLVNVVKKGENFANLVAAYSADKASAADGELGSIGWMSQTQMIQGFESVLEAKAGEPFALETIYGSHVILVTEKSEPVEMKQVALLEKTALASKETFNKYYSDANTFATIANGSFDGYKKALDTTKVYSHTATVTEATSTYGTIDSAKELTRWVFDNKEGKVSNIITVNNNYFFVAAVKKIHKEGYATVEEAADVIRQQLYAEKVHDKKVADMKEKIKGAGSIEAAAEALGLSVDHIDALSLAATSQDPALLGAVAAAQEGQVYGPVAGAIGAYVVKASNKQTGSFYTTDDAKNLAAQKASYMSQLILSVMSEYDNVKDNRERFF